MNEHPEATAGKAAGQSVSGFRVGQGFDVHALVPGRRLIIGGVAIEHTHGLLGHSDADVLLHAITDAVLGAAGLGDIGRMFPDTDPAHKDADSRKLLALAAQRVRSAGWRIVNVDCTVIAQRPRIAPHVAAMQAVIAEALGIGAADVNIKGKTTEWLGFTGRGEGIAAQALALISASA
jgi:2-C-methyl-D-erythritol 2,4-cyclodiphosphate synthase